MLYVEDAKLEHLPQLAMDLTEMDKHELKALSGHDPLEGLKLSFDNSERAWTVMWEDTPVGIFGGKTMSPSVAMVWFLNTNKLKKHAREFLSGCNPWVEQVHEKLRCNLLYNYAYVKNTVHHKWCRRAGFIVDTENEYAIGVNGAPFYNLYKYKELY